MTEAQGPEDIMGREIMAGDIVAYAVRDGNTGELKVAEVVETKFHHDGGYWTWKVRAFLNSGYRGLLMPRKAQLSSPSFSKSVIVSRKVQE